MEQTLINPKLQFLQREAPLFIHDWIWTLMQAGGDEEWWEN